ncbi:hypothetical protein [Nioella sp.]|uniref:hypothetical protein n=1 Tax=Nioella sp. TaxID=1912091 RepID=UPI003A842DBD
MKWFVRLVIVLLLGFLGFAAYDYYRAGYHTLPELEDGDFPLSFASGLRGVMHDVDDLRETRVYAGYPAEVPSWLEDVWSHCEARELREEDRIPNLGVGYRYEAVCTIEVEGEEVIRGVIYSRPEL